MSTNYTSYSVNGLVKHYNEQNNNGTIKLYFRKADIRKHSIPDNKPFYTVRPLVAKYGDIFDEHIDYNIYIKNKLVNAINNTNKEMWVMISDNNISYFKNDEGKDIEFHDVKLKYIVNQNLIDMIMKHYINNIGIDECYDIEL